MLRYHPDDKHLPLGERRWVCRECGYLVFTDEGVAHAHLLTHLPRLLPAPNPIAPTAPVRLDQDGYDQIAWPAA